MVARYAADPGLGATAYGNLGSAYRQMGESMKAKRCFEMALQLAPDRPMAMIGLGLIAQKNGDLPEAVRQYSHAMAIQPTDVGFLLLAQVLQQQGHSEEANAIFERVARLSPNPAEAQKAAESLLSGK
jgi:Tfp pilus assembly protein PilF